ncbi:MAG: hypothetical protein ACREUN_16865, partial [Burkholderiales bacterium]
AYRAIAQLRFPHDASAPQLLSSYKAKDEQRRFQFHLADIVLREGTMGLARRWFTLGTLEQRNQLIGEIEQFWNEWESEGAVEVAITALDEPDDKVRGYALLCVRTALTWEGTQKFITPERRARITQALVRAMARHDEKPMGLFWLEKYVELLGLVGDASVLARLEKLRPFSGASRRMYTEKLDPENLPLPFPKKAADIPPGVPVPVAMVSDVGTGLLEIKVLEKALKQIRGRKA